MRGNQGLDALAALCGGANPSEKEENKSSSNQGRNSIQLPMNNGGRNRTTTSTPQLKNPAFATNHSTTDNSQQHFAPMSAPNWQQLLSQSSLANSNNMGAFLNAPGAFMMPNFTANNTNNQHQQQNDHNQQNQNNINQQLAMYNLLQQAQKKSNMAQSAFNEQSMNNHSAQPFAMMDPNSALTALLASQLRQQAGSNTFTSNTIPQNGTMNSPLFQQQFQQVSDDVYNNKLQAHQKNDMIKSESNKVNSKVSMPTMTLQNVTQSSSSNNQIRLNDYDSDERNDDNDIENSNLTMDEKKIRKRDLNRKSAQLSRKRKKLFIEELKEENDILRRKVEILRSIPDLVIVFDSGGNIEFVSQSVSQFLDFTPQELQGSSFWDRLSDDSVRQMKAAFMDALALKSKGSQSTSLGNNVWNLSLLDKNGTEKFVSLNGTVHFYGDAPECVCSIRHRNTTEPTTEAAKSASSKPLETKNEGFTAKEIVEMSSKQQIKFKGRGGIPQISDADSSSAMSETTND